MIDINKIKLSLPEGVATDGDISLSGNIATVNLVSSTIGQKTISASYDDGDPVSTILNVTEETLFLNFVTEPASKVFTGDTIKVIATFSKIPNLADLTITPPPRFTAKTEAKVEGLTIVAEYTAPRITTEQMEFTANWRNNTTVKTASIIVLEKPAILQHVEVEPRDIRLSEATTLTATFDKAPKIEEVDITVSEGLEVQEESKIVDNTVITKYKGVNTGEKTITVKHNGIEKAVTVNVLSDAIISNVVGEPEPVTIGGTVNITVTYDKARLENQPPVEVQLDAGLAEKTAYAENPEKTGGSMQIIGSEPGDKTVTFVFGGKPKILKITVNPE